MTFTLEGLALKEAEKFKDEHWNCGHPTAGEKFTYSFCPTGLGTIIKIKCNCCGKVQDISDDFD